MGKARNKGEGPGAGGEEARPSGGPDDSAPVKEEGNAGGAEGSAPAPAPAPPAPAPRKRGRPRKVVAPKVEENAETTQTQAAQDAETKKPKAESPPGRNGSTTVDVHQSTVKNLPVHLPLRREGSRRKSEPRRAAD